STGGRSRCHGRGAGVDADGSTLQDLTWRTEGTVEWVIPSATASSTERYTSASPTPLEKIGNGITRPHEKTATICFATGFCGPRSKLRRASLIGQITIGSSIWRHSRASRRSSLK